jgi:hypothetical protein
VRAVTSRRIAEKARFGEREAAAALCALTAEHRELVARLLQERLSFYRALLEPFNRALLEPP